MRRKGRPYPRDPERRIRVKIELARRDMTISDLARALNVKQSVISAIINGRRISPKTEAKIAAYFGLPAETLFPRKSRRDLIGMPGEAL